MRCEAVYAAMRHFHSKDHISKILIHGYYYSPFRVGFFKYSFVFPPSATLIGRGGVMIILAQPVRDRRAYALVNQKSHLNGLDRDGDEGGILKRLGGKEKTGINVIFRQAGILHQDLFHGGGMSKESQDVLHGEPSALDDGFAYHYFGIYGYSFQ
jgi:hypothetical protein